MIRLLAVWTVALATAILLVVLREDQLVARGKVPLGRLRRLWFRNERRRAPRFRVSWEIRYTRVKGQAVSSAQTRDASQSGAQIALSEKLPVGSLLQVELIPPHTQNPVLATAAVMWVREVPAVDDHPRQFLAGIQFQNLSPAAGETISKALGETR